MSKLKSLSKLAITGAVSATIGGLGLQQSVSAMEFAPTRINIDITEAVEFSSNTIDFGGIGADLGFDAANAGAFSITDIDDPHGVLALVGLGIGSTGLAYDLIPGVGSDTPLLDGTFPSSGLFLTFDGTQIEYYYSEFTRTTQGTAATGFQVRLDFVGEFRDGSGTFDTTPSQISLFTAATTESPEIIPSTPGANSAEVIDNFNNSIPVAASVASANNGVITTEKTGTRIPEPGTVLGLLAVSGLGLGLKKKKQS